MELYVAVSGDMKSQHRWAEDLTAVFLPVWYDGKQVYDDNNIPIKRRLLVSPLQIYKLATNKENLDELMAVVGTNNYILKRYKILNKVAKTLRKILGLKPVPKPKYLRTLYQPNQVDKAVAVTPIGIKDDIIKDGKELI